MLVLTKSDIRQVVSMNDAIELVKTAFGELKAGRADMPLRSFIDVRPGIDTMLMMPAYLSEMGALGFKVVSIYQENSKKNLPVANALVCVVDHETGIPAAIMNGTYLTQLRTGAVSGLSAELMAREDAKNLVVVGAGAQGVTQAAAVCAVRDIEKITVVDRRPESFERYKQSISEDWPDLLDRIETAEDGEHAIRGADIICLATTARQPVFEAEWIKPGTHISGVGSFTPEMQETHPEFVKQARVVADMKEHCLEEAGDLIIPIKEGLVSEDHIVAEMGDLVAGDVQGRENDEQLTFFKSVGVAVQDISVAAAAVNRAQEKGIGQQIDLG